MKHRNWFRWPAVIFSLAIICSFPVYAENLGPGSEIGSGTGDVSGPGMVFDTTGVEAVPLEQEIVGVVEKYSYDEMITDLKQLKLRYGDLLTVNIVGTSLDGRYLCEAVVGNQESGKNVMIQGGIHGREYMTPLLIMKQLEMALSQYSTGNYQGTGYAAMFQQGAIHFLPMVNPDGVSISQYGLSSIHSQELRTAVEGAYAADLANGRTTMPMERYLNYWKANGRGVDLNGNFDAGWDQVYNVGYPSYSSYKGIAPCSEPESMALFNLANKYSWSAIVNYHSMGEVVYWDFAGNRVQTQSNELADLVVSLTGYRKLGASGAGGYKDWLQIKENPVPSITIEVGSVACPMPVSEWDNVWTKNQNIWAAVLHYAVTH